MKFTESVSNRVPSRSTSTHIRPPSLGRPQAWPCLARLRRSAGDPQLAKDSASTYVK